MPERAQTSVISTLDTRAVPAAETPAVQRASIVVDTQAIQIASISGTTLLRLRSWIPRQEQSARIVLAGQELPSQVGTTLSGEMRVLCLAPQEWLIVSQERDPSRLRSRLEPDLAKYGLALLDLSDGLATFGVQGAAARELLSKGCGLDLHPRKLPAGFCARTRFAQVQLTIACVSDSPRFELFVGRSYAHYLQAWLTDAAAAYR